MRPLFATPESRSRFRRVCGAVAGMVLLGAEVMAAEPAQSKGPNAADSRRSASAVRDPWVPAERPRDWQYLVLHHSATKDGSVESIHQAHLMNRDQFGQPWLGIGYHFVIGNGNGMDDGEVEPTFRWRGQLQGAHAGSVDHNERGIGICLIGNFQEAPPSARQLESLERLTTYLAKRHAIDSESIVGHGSVRATECPGRNFPLQQVRKRLALHQNDVPTAVSVRLSSTPFDAIDR